jgi:hypothetical protein
MGVREDNSSTEPALVFKEKEIEYSNSGPHLKNQHGFKYWALDLQDSL